MEVAWIIWFGRAERHLELARVEIEEQRLWLFGDAGDSAHGCRQLLGHLFQCTRGVGDDRQRLRILFPADLFETGGMIYHFEQLDLCVLVTDCLAVATDGHGGDD